MKVHNIKVKAFCHQDELESTKKALRNIMPEDVRIEESVLEPESEGEIFTKPLVVLRAKLDKTKVVEEFMNNLNENLPGSDKKEILNNLESRVDEDCNLYIRLSKGEALRKKFVLKDHDPIHVKIKIAVYPKKKENAVKMVKEII